MNTTTRFLHYIHCYRHRFIIAIFFSCCYGFFSAAPAYLLQHMVDTIFVAHRTGLLLLFICCFIALFIGKALCMYISTYLLQQTGYRVVNNIRRDLFSRVISFPLSFFHRYSTGDIMSRFLNDISTLQYAASVGVRNGLRSIVEAISLLSIALYQNIFLTGLSLIVAPLIALAIKHTGARMKRASRITQNDMGAVRSNLQEALTGIRSIKAFNGEQREHNRFAHLLSTYFSSIMSCVHYEALGPPLVELIAVSGCSLVLFTASHQMINNTISPGQLSSLFAALLLAYQPIKRAISVYGDINYGLGAAHRIFALLDAAEQLPTTVALPPLPSFKKAIVFESVSFSYHDEHPILSNTSLTIQRGERLGIIGPSGSGKSTISDLILQFIRPTAGRILIDGINIATFCPRSIRQHIGYVGQHPFLFNDTIYANVSYGNPSAHMDDIIAVCQLAHAHHFISTLPDGYHTQVGENGNLLSGGQKQRITIARALIKNPAILIFDEATSALDTASQKAIMQMIDELDTATTVIVITHQPALLKSMDNILTITNQQLHLVSESRSTLLF